VLDIVLTREQRKALDGALNHAFRTPTALARMVRYGLDETLAAIAGDGAEGLEFTVFRLVEWAVEQGRLGELIEAALAANPSNPLLQDFVKSLRYQVGYALGARLPLPGSPTPAQVLQNPQSPKVDIKVAPEILAGRDVAAILGRLVGVLDVPLEEIRLVAAAMGSTRLLIGLAHDYSMRVAALYSLPDLYPDYILAVRDFNLLPPAEQADWRWRAAHPEEIPEPHLALAYWEYQRAIEDATGDQAALAAALFNLGQVYRRMSMPHQALMSYVQALSLQEATGNLAQQATTLASIRELYGALGGDQAAPGLSPILDMIPIPFVIDNQQHKMADVLNAVLAEHAGRALDVATAYFNVGGWQLLQAGLQGLGQFRLLLGDEPETGADLGLRPASARPVRGLIRDLAAAPFQPATLRLVEDLIAFLHRESVEVRLYTHGFLHAKCYLFYSGGGFAHFTPVAAIVGSSNFTRPGLTTNKELNLSHRATLGAAEIESDQLAGLLDRADRQVLAALTPESRQVAARVPGVLAINELADWYARQWAVATDFKQGLIDLLDASKFGRKEYPPYEVYLKAMFELFREEIDSADAAANVRSVVDLSEFQEDAVKKARKILARYDGVLIGDSVGLGKTWIGKKLLEDYAYHLRYQALVVCPAALRGMWERELRDAGIAAQVVTQESLGREEYDIHDVQTADVVLVDESHNFRNRNAQRYEALERILAANNRRGGRSGERKKLILLTATPINNTVFDLYHQIGLLTGGDRSYFVAAGIGDLYRYFHAARQRARQQESGIALFNLLEEVVIRRTRPFIKAAYPNATIQGQPIHWPERRLKTVRYDLEATYAGIYETVVRHIEGLRLAPYRLETYKKQGIARDQFEEGREEALAGIFKSRYLKRFESSVAAFRISVRRALEFLETFESYVLDGKVLDSSSFQKAMRFLAREDEEDDATPGSQADALDAHAEARAFLDTLPALDATQYDLKRLHGDIRKDAAALAQIWQAIAPIAPERDAKLAALQAQLAGELRGQKVLVFTYYKDTARYLAQQLGGNTPAAIAWRAAAGDPVIRHMDSGADARERAGIVAAFAPRANKRPELEGTPAEIAILISTDVLSEGQNLQDCGMLINYDLHWNPTRMVQRAGRIDRIGSTFETLWVLNLFPDHGLERLLGLVQSLSAKIAQIDNAGFLDASVLGEVVHPQNFNTLRRIAAEDGTVVEEQEQFVELVSSEFLIQNLKNLLDAEMRAKLEELPDGIHSGLTRPGERGVFFYFTAPAPNRARGGAASDTGTRHFWRYIELTTDRTGGRIEDNRYLITTRIQCQRDEPRVVPAPGEVDIFALQEKVIASIVQSAQEQVAREEAPRLLDPIQQTVATVLREYINSPAVERKAVIAGMQKLLEPQPGVYLKALKRAYDAFTADGQIPTLLTAVQGLGEPVGEERPATPAADKSDPIRREDLRLICFDYVWS